MAQSGENPTPEDFARLEESIKDLRQQLELIHLQQAYLQMQVTASLNGEVASVSSLNARPSHIRELIVRIAKKNRILYKLAVRVSRFLRR